FRSSGTTGGAGGSGGGGAGGNAPSGSNTGNGSAGTAPGGGGGGGRKGLLGSNATGGQGARGQIRLTYEVVLAKDVPVSGSAESDDAEGLKRSKLKRPLSTGTGASAGGVRRKKRR